MNYTIDNVSFVFPLKFFCNMHVYSKQKSDEKVLNAKRYTGNVLKIKTTNFNFYCPVTRARGALIKSFKLCNRQLMFLAHFHPHSSNLVHFSTTIPVNFIVYSIYSNSGYQYRLLKSSELYKPVTYLLLIR